MNFLRISALIKRYNLITLRDFGKLFDLFYWPSIDIFLFGFTGVWLSGSQESLNVLSLFTGLVLIQIFWRTAAEISGTFLEEIWSNNVVNIFCSPVKVSEWLTGGMTLGLGKSFIAVAYASSLIYFAYGVNTLKMGNYLLYAYPLIVITGWALGLFIASIFLIFGMRLQIFNWAIPWLIVLPSGVFYPTEILPTWVQKISQFIPLTYVLKGMRYKYETGQINFLLIWKASILAIGYLFIALFIFKCAFAKSKESGLAKIEHE